MGDMQRGFVLGSWLHAMRRAEGWSYADVATHASRHGHKVSASGVERMEKVRPVMVKKDQIAWVVDVFGIPPRNVVRQFLKGMGYSMDDSSMMSLEDAIVTDAQLGRRDKQLLSALLAAMRSANLEEGTSWSGDPMLEESECGVADAKPASPLGNDLP